MYIKKINDFIWDNEHDFENNVLKVLKTNNNDQICSIG